MAPPHPVASDAVPLLPRAVMKAGGELSLGPPAAEGEADSSDTHAAESGCVIGWVWSNVGVVTHFPYHNRIKHMPQPP